MTNSLICDKITVAKESITIHYGLKEGDTLTTKKSIAAKEIIIKYSKDFNGTLKDADVCTLAKISRNSYYKYKAELRAERAEQEEE